jgi:hypothetical protein
VSNFALFVRDVIVVPLIAATISTAAFIIVIVNIFGGTQ